MVPEKQIEGSGFGSTSSNWNLASNLLVAARFLIRFAGFHFSIKWSRAIWCRGSRCINKTEWKRLGLMQEFWSVWYRYCTRAEWQIYRLDSRLSSRGTRVSSTAAIGPVGSCDSTVTEQGEGGRRSQMGKWRCERGIDFMDYGLMSMLWWKGSILVTTERLRRSWIYRIRSTTPVLIRTIHTSVGIDISIHQSLSVIT